MAIALNAVSQFFDDNGDALSGGKVWTYAAGTLTPLATYTNQDGNVANTNPVILDAAGRAQIWLTPNVPYKIRVTNSADVELEITDEFYAGMNPEQLTIAGQVPASGGTFTGPVILAGGSTFSGTAAQDLATLDSLGIAAVRNENLWTNPEFTINQRAAATAIDGGYGWDRSMVLCETGSITVSQFDTATLAPGGTAGRLTQPDASPKRMGICQIVEARDVLAYRGRSLVMAAHVRATGAATLRMALVAWTGTQDAPTHDVVNTWSSTNYTAGNFFVANTAVIAIAAVALSSGAWTEVSVSSASPGGVVAPTTMKNLYMVFWTEATAAQNLTLDFTAVRCGQGTEAPRWLPPNAQVELAKCKRFLAMFAMSAVGQPAALGQCTTTASALLAFPFDVEPRIVPTGVTSIGAAYLTTASGAATANLSTFTFTAASLRKALCTATVASGLVAGNATVLLSNSTNTQFWFTGPEF